MMRSGPHQITIGKRDARQVATEALSVSGQYAGGPSGESDQSWLCMRAPILPPQLRKPRGLGLTIDTTCTIHSLRCDPAGSKDGTSKCAVHKANPRRSATELMMATTPAPSGVVYAI